MKIRNGFVTNSSSSSFIIGKKDSNITVDDVYNIIKREIEEDISNKKTFLQRCEEFDIDYTTKKEGNYEYITITYEAIKKSMQKKPAFAPWIDRLKYNNLWFYVDKEENELLFDTYEEYAKHWNEKIQRNSQKWEHVFQKEC